MTSFSSIQRRRRKLIDDLIEFSCGLDDKLIEKVIVYAECLFTPDTEDISEPTFISEMAFQFNMTSNYIISLVFDVIKASRSSKRTVTLEQYCKLICIFMTKDINRKINYVFAVYDIDHDEILNRAEVYAMLKPTLPQNDDEQEDMLKELIELVMKIVDRDGNGLVELEEFRELVQKNVLYMDLLGQCIPDDRTILKFIKKLMGKTVLEVKEYFTNEATITQIGGLKTGKKTGYYPFTLEF